MSRSLSRIRNLISEIEEIHRQGQQGGQVALNAASPILSSVERIEISASPVATPIISAVTVSAPVAAPVPIVPTEAETEDPFLELAQMVNLDEKRAPKTEPKNEPVQEGKVSLKLSGAIELSLQIENTGETVSLKQVGNMLEIHFADGKAFHIPLKTVA